VLTQFIRHNQGRRVPLRFTLAPGYYIARLRALKIAFPIPRLWRWRLSWFSCSAPLALRQ